MARFLKDVERILKDRTSDQLNVLLHYYGIELKIFNQRKNVHTSVYGSSAGEVVDEDEFTLITGIILGDDFSPTDNLYAGDFIPGQVFTDQEVPIGAVIEVSSQDGRIRRFKVNKKVSIGTTTNIINIYDIISIGD